ncbi:MAG: hypothetical protein PHG83_04280 [Patescibacteria group bacterium]|nr:hypothetical protein [Patescibacteria group bacterium]
MNFFLMFVLVLIGTKTGEAKTWDEFATKFSSPVFFCRGECTDFRVEVISDSTDILACYDLFPDSKPESEGDKEIYELYWNGKTVDNPFRKKLPFVITVETNGNCNEMFIDENFDGIVDQYSKGYSGQIGVKGLSSEAKKKVQTRFDQLLGRLIKEMEKQENNFVK